MPCLVRWSCLLAVVVATSACGRTEAPGPIVTAEPSSAPSTFASDVGFLRQHVPVVVLQSTDGQSQVAIVPAWQGRVMTSTGGGDMGLSHGYLHRAVITQEAPQPHMTVLGGEDRFWLGPEGGQFGLYFPPGLPFSTETWQVPQVIDWDDWPIVEQDRTHVRVARATELNNYAGTRFHIRIDRAVRVLEAADISEALGVEPAPSIRVVGYESDNTLTNIGDTTWTRESGALSIWILGMYPPGPKTTVMIPFVEGPESTLGPVINDAYFGAIPPDRLRIENGVVYFRGDGARRGKIGVPRARARDVAGSYDPDRGVLTVVTFTMPAESHDYVNSMWEFQADPFGGDVVNSYNDGPLESGAPQLGPFYEIESSSPAAFLEPDASIRHVQRTFHFEGPPEALDAVARRMLGVGLP